MKSMAVNRVVQGWSADPTMAKILTEVKNNFNEKSIT